METINFKELEDKTIGELRKEMILGIEVEALRIELKGGNEDDTR